jgi:hypothetical protein
MPRRSRQAEEIMLRKMMWRKMKMAAAAATLTMAFTGLALAQDGYRFYDRDNYGYGRTAFRVAQDFGFEDGSFTARQDLVRAKPYNPNPRGSFKHADRGYRREFGDKYEYREAYARAYRQGYDRIFRRY